MTQSIPAGLLCALVVNPLAAKTSFPMVTHCAPVAVQRGQSADVTVEGQMNFAGATGVLTDHPGLTATIVPGPPPKAGAAPKPDAKPAAVRSAKLRVTAAPDAPLGPHEF